VYAGLDLASTRDVSALVLLAPSAVDGVDYDMWEHYFVPADGIAQRARDDGVPYDTWRDGEALEATSGNTTDYDVIRERIKRYADDYAIGFAELAYDRWNANQLITQLGNDGLVVVPTGQGYASMAGPCRALETAIAGRRIRHRGNPVTRWMVGNVTTTEDPAGNLKPDRSKSADKIDGVVSLLMALGRAVMHAGEEYGEETSEVQEWEY
jgi:phage terminase large subunit-like protein